MKISEDLVVKLNYTLFDSEGTQLDTSIGKSAFEYVHGHKMIIPGLEKALEGRETGEKFRVEIPSVDAYGSYDDRLLIEVEKSQFDTDVPIEVGMAFQASSPNGGAMIVHVVKVTENTITVDGNHELAGKDLVFDVEILEVREATEEELNFSSGCSGYGGNCSGCGDDCSSSCEGGCSNGCK